MNRYQEDIEHIHTMMERSTRFISLSGVSGIFAGFVALISSGLAYYFFEKSGIYYFSGNRLIYTDTLLKQLILTCSNFARCPAWRYIFYG